MLYGLSSALYAEGLISLATNDEVINGRDRDMIKASRLVLVLQKQIKGNKEPHSYVKRLCSVFKKQDDETIHDIATTLLKEIGNYMTTHKLPHECCHNASTIITMSYMCIS